MDVAAQDRVDLVAFRRAQMSSANLGRHRVYCGIAELVASWRFTGLQPTAIAGRFRLNVSERRKPRLHAGAGGKEAGHRMFAAVQLHDPFGQIHEAAALPVDRGTGARELEDRYDHGPILLML